MPVASTELAPWIADPLRERCFTRSTYGFERAIGTWHYDWHGAGEAYLGLAIDAAQVSPDGTPLNFEKFARCWATLLTEMPDMACRISRESIRYEPLAGAEAMAHWLSSTLIHEPPAPHGTPIELVLDRVRFRESTQPLLSSQTEVVYPMKVFVCPIAGATEADSPYQTFGLFMRGHHYLFDACSMLRLLSSFLEHLSGELDEEAHNVVLQQILSSNGSEASKLRRHPMDVVGITREQYDNTTFNNEVMRKLMMSKIGFPISADFADRASPWPVPAPPTDTYHIALSKDLTTKFIAACKAQDVTVTYGLGAALLVAGLSDTRPNGGDDPVDAALLVIFNLRRWMTEEQQMQTASGADTGILSATTKEWDDAIRAGKSGDELRKAVFWPLAHQLKGFFKKFLSTPLSFAGKGPHDFWDHYNSHAKTLMDGTAPHPLATGYNINSVGILEKVVSPEYPSRTASPGAGTSPAQSHALSLRFCQIAFRATGILTMPHFWTFRDQLHINMSYCRQMFPPGGPQSLVNSIMDSVVSMAGGTTGAQGNVTIMPRDG